MNTTLNPPPTDREREMLAEWAVTLSARHGWNAEASFTGAEALLCEFRTRYGVTGAEAKPYIHADFDLDKVLSEAISVGELNPESAENVRRTMLKYGYCQVNKPEPIREANITLKEVCGIWGKSKYSRDAITMYSDVSGGVFSPFGKKLGEFDDLSELLAILKGGNDE